MVQKNIFLSRFLFLLFFGSVIFGCNTNSKNNAEQTIVEKPINTKLQALINHFKNADKFPLIIDSTYIATINKNDSLGTNEVKMLTQNFFNDSLVLSDTNLLSDFYKIDSVKANHTFEKWSEKLDIGMTEYANAYALQKINLNDSVSLLVWALSASSYEADPNWYSSTIYFTQLIGKNIGETFVLGQYFNWIDPPSAYQLLLSGNLTKNGKLVLEKNEQTEDLDDSATTITQTHFEYLVNGKKIELKEKKVTENKNISWKATNH